MNRDPSFEFIKTQLNFLEWKELIKNYQLASKITSSVTIPYLAPRKGNYNIFSEEKLIKQLHDIQNYFSLEAYDIVRDNLETTEKLANVFANRAGIKLANLDALYRFSDFSLEKPQDNRSIRYLDLGAAPGSWSQYIQYRYTTSYGYLFSYKAGLAYQKDILNEEHINYIWKDDINKEGNLLTEADELIEYLNEREEGLDLIVADAAPGAEQDEELAQRAFLISELYIILNVAKEGSNCVIKIFAAQNLITQQLIWLLSQCYEEVFLSKPITSKAANAELYLVAKNCFSQHKRKIYITYLYEMYKTQGNVVQLWLPFFDLTINNIKTLSKYYLTQQLEHSLLILQDLQYYLQHHELNKQLEILWPQKLFNAWVVPSLNKNTD